MQRFLFKCVSFLSPTKRWFWKTFYNTLAKKIRSKRFKFMNYGYSEEGLHPQLEGQDEQDRLPIHLYHHTVSQVDVDGKEILEVGSGRGGGASYITRYLNPKSVRGIDISKGAINFCNKTYRTKTLSFTEGDAENMAFDDESFDIVLNVESSHSYGSMKKFLSEVSRVLKPGGHFVWCDLRKVQEIKELNEQFSASDLDQTKGRDITPNVLASLDKLSEPRNRSLSIKSFILPTSNPLEKQIISSLTSGFSGIKGSKIYDAILTGEAMYLSATFRKPS